MQHIDPEAPKSTQDLVDWLVEQRIVLNARVAQITDTLAKVRELREMER